MMVGECECVAMCGHVYASSLYYRDSVIRIKYTNNSWMCHPFIAATNFSIFYSEIIEKTLALVSIGFVFARKLIEKKKMTTCMPPLGSRSSTHHAWAHFLRDFYLSSKQTDKIDWVDNVLKFNVFNDRYSYCLWYNYNLKYSLSIFFS